MEDYMFWYAHGELYPTQEIGQCSISETAQDNDEGVGDYRRYEQMIIESMHQPEAPYYQQAPYCQQAKQNPNQSARTFYKMLNQVSEPLWDGSKKASTLSTTTSLIAVNTCFLLRPPPIDTSIDASHPLSKTLNLSLNSSALESKHPTINLHRLTFGFSFLVSNFSEKIGSPHYPQSLNIVGMECRLILRSSTSARFKATCETIKFGCSKEAKSCTQGQCYIHIRCVQTPCIQKSRRRKI
ncbi:uncharacterized protein LOC111904448 [Lactuca sativa]|uniref:uncharacterized protein LOC111904448 n=1 Tax=Lactuca sativa TaxID=4236 RepID=UPI0022AF262D|nr:uncharacterized protein LOC111904448 [Lactuca sativa]